jgi:Amt family ammonium transporter
VLSVIGAALLWVGWFGFNAGSALSAGGLASSAFVATHFAAAAGTLAWSFIEWFKSGKPTVLGAISGAVAGLVCITPASGFTTPMYAILIGLIGATACFISATTLKHKFGYDDALDAFGVHGTGGTVGALLTGVFAVAAVNAGVHTRGLLEGNYRIMLNQSVATAVTWAIAIVGSFVLLKITAGLCGGLRVSEENEFDGLDLSQHGESGYNLEDALSATFGGGGGGATLLDEDMESEAASVQRH